MILTHDNYFSKEANDYYMSNSLYKTFLECEERAMSGWQLEPTDAMLVGSYIDTLFDGSTAQFSALNPEMFTGKGTLKANFLYANDMFDRMEMDPLMKEYNNGEQQVIMTAELFGVPWKIMIDSYHKDKCIVDRKKCKDFEPMWKDGRKMPWIEYWGYDIQGAIYQAVEGNKLPFIISAVTMQTKTKGPDIDLLYIPQDILDMKLGEVEQNMPHIMNVKNGLEAPTRCGVCEYCKETKVLKEVRAYR